MINWDNVEFKNSKRFLSNMFDCVIVIDGKSYPSSENYYMACKFKSEIMHDYIRRLTPLEAKSQAYTWKHNIRPDWDDIKVTVMETALKTKFSQNKDLAELLVATGSEHLEERNDWNDKFWGTYLGEGLNTLGLLLMKIRDELQEEKS